MAPMSFAQPRRFILVSGVALVVSAMVGGCGQKGALYLPDSPAAAQRASLPQTVFGGAKSTPAPARAASVPASPPSPVLPDLPDIQ